MERENLFSFQFPKAAGSIFLAGRENLLPHFIVFAEKHTLKGERKKTLNLHRRLVLISDEIHHVYDLPKLNLERWREETANTAMRVVVALSLCDGCSTVGDVVVASPRMLGWRWGWWLICRRSSADG
ncbi:Uncharacterized protein Fot_42676 [Forsythia ovata]|uniref:Uncharacterized protein n=1 Tax=Forsythia ovata TaxID=205694 RepID=A0ABD1RQQ8_9LAMI